MTTWTPRALASSAQRYDRELWRVVEAQHIASTMRLVDTLDEQLVLEATLEASKPKLPPEAAKLHYLLATPFRYRPHLGSRFRGPLEAGVWYGAEELRTALAEKSYWQLRFLLDSPSMPDLKPVPHKAFVAAVAASSIDLTATPLVRDRAKWTHRTSYVATQALAATARAGEIGAIRYESVRDPEHSACVAVLTPESFKRTKPRLGETWFIAASRERVRCTGEAGPGPSWEFATGELL